MEKEKFIIIDTPAILHRAWHALPKLTDKTGRVVNAVYGFSSVFLKILREFRPTFIAACFDTPAPTFRHQVYKEYKATRLPQSKEFYDQIPLVKEVLQAFNVSVFEKEGYEADDLIGILVYKYQHLVPEIIIITGDLDALQLVNNRVKVYFLKQGISEVKIYDEKEVEARYGLSPQQLVDFKALRGDPSDNIPGVPGIGEKTAQDLIRRFGSLEAVYQHLADCEQGARECEIKNNVRKLLNEEKERAILSKKLVTILKEAPKDFVFEVKSWSGPNIEKVEEVFNNFGFKSLLERFKKNEINPKQNTIF